MAKHPWLTIRRSVYYLRAPVPLDIRESFGKSEVTFSLRTKERRQADRLIHGKAKEVAERFEAHRRAGDHSGTKAHALAPAKLFDPYALQIVCEQHFTSVIDWIFEQRANVLEQVRADRQGFVDGKYIKHPTTDWYLTFFEDLKPEQALLVCFNQITKERLTAVEDALSLGDCTLGDAAAVGLALSVGDADRRRVARRLMESEAQALRSILDKDYGRYEQIMSQHVQASAQNFDTPQPAKSKRGPTWEAFIADWAKAHADSKGSPKIRKEWRARLLAFAKFCGVAPAKVADSHVRAWRDKRLSDGLSPITVGNSDIACIRAIFARAIREKMLAGPNPAKDVVVDNMDRAARRMKGFTNDDAAAILAAAKLQTVSWKRWVPWLCAFTGSRVSTMMNLRYCDIKLIDGYHIIEVTEDAGPTKTHESARVVPIHPALLSDGFLDFVATRRSSRLFFEEDRERHGVGEYNPGKGRCERLAKWVRSIPGITVGREHGKDPSHAWRHWLKTALRTASIPDSVADRITGHAPRTDGASYGTSELDAMFDALSKVPIPHVRRY